MKKDELVNSIDRAGETINDLNVRAWTTALHPTHYGWGPSIASIVAIPVLNLASIGNLVSSAVVKQIPPDMFDKLPGSGKSEGDG